eukprot:jgi/Mesvir1/20045/Mv13296-RA.1
MSAALLLLVLVPVLVVVILWQAGVIGKKDSEEDPADTEEETQKEEEAKAAKAKEEAEAKAAEEEAAKKRAQELIAEVTAGKTKPLEEMSVKELTDELTKAMVATGGDESDPKVKKLMELIRGNIAATDDAIGMPSTADIASVQQTAAKTGLETASVQTMSYVQRMFREIFKFSARDLTSKLTAAFTKTYDAEADRLRSIRDNLTEGSKQKTIAERGAKEVKIAEFERLSDSAEAAFGRVINSEPRGAMFQAIWTLFDIQTLTLPDISTFVSRPFDWVGKSDENAQRMREFVFGNEFFK